MNLRMYESDKEAFSRILELAPSQHRDLFSRHFCRNVILKVLSESLPPVDLGDFFSGEAEGQFFHGAFKQIISFRNLDQLKRRLIVEMEKGSRTQDAFNYWRNLNLTVKKEVGYIEPPNWNGHVWTFWVQLVYQDIFKELGVDPDVPASYSVLMPKGGDKAALMAWTTMLLLDNAVHLGILKETKMIDVVSFLLDYTEMII